MVGSPAEQEVTILDGCRLFVNGEKAFGVDHMEVAKAERDSVNVNLKKEPCVIELKVHSGDTPKEFRFTITSKVELKLPK